MAGYYHHIRTSLRTNDVRLGLGCAVLLVIWYGAYAIWCGVWGVAGVLCWCLAFTAQGRLHTRGQVDDNVSCCALPGAGAHILRQGRRT